MIFNLKYLILPLSIMACINNNCINAMENNIINEEHQTSMKWNDFEKLISSFNLDNSKVEFIKNIANAASSISKDKSTWHNLSHKRLLFPRSNYFYHSKKVNTIMSKAMDNALNGGNIKIDENKPKNKFIYDYIRDLKMTYDIEIDRLKQTLNLKELLRKTQTSEGMYNLIKDLLDEFKYVTFKKNIKKNSDLLKSFSEHIYNYYNEMEKLYSLLVENEKNKNLTLQKLYELLEKKLNESFEKESIGFKFFTELFESRKNDLKIYESFRKTFEEGMSKENVPDILLYTKHSAWENIQNGINRDNINNFFVSNYGGFISAIKQCHKQGYISLEQYESLLKWLLYINTYDTFNTIRYKLLVTIDFLIPIYDLKEQNGDYREKYYTKDKNIQVLLDYLLGNKYQDVENIFILGRNNKCNNVNKYLNKLPIIKEIIDNFVSLSVENHTQNSIKKDKNLLKEEIISIIMQGIYDNAYYRNRSEYKNPDEKFNEMFTSKVAQEKIDKEFSVTKIIDRYIK